MYDPHYERLINHDDNFEPQKEYECFNIPSTIDEKEPLLNLGRLGYDKNDEWTKWLYKERSHDGNCRLKVLTLSPSSKEAFHPHQLLCSRDIWKTIEDAWELPKSVFKSLIGGGAKPVLWQRHSQKRGSTNLGFTIVQKGLKIWLSITTVYDLSSRNTSVIINCGLRENADLVLADFQRCLSQAWIPSLLPVLVIEHIMSEYENTIQDSFKRLNRVRTAIGINPYSHTKASNDLDLLQQSIELTHLAQHFAAMETQFDILATNVATVAQFHEKLCTNLQSPAVDVNQEALMEIHERLEHASRHVQLRLQWNACRVAEVQASIQTVYSLVGNRDNVLNFRAAQASIHIAELARKDSADMRVIAVVTLLFLPATFVAPDNDAKHVSSWYWLYWVVTFGLTLAIGLAWFWSSRVFAKKSTSHLEALDKSEG
ncbi:MAG: hypothetical protein M1821_009716 [Bathelium mastoideum]|nr:MAG: hypothetical protein M1821_009716 [Bathelium mastoideum]